MKYLARLEERRPFLKLYNNTDITGVAINRTLSQDTGVGSLKELQDVVKALHASDNIIYFSHHIEKKVIDEAHAAHQRISYLENQLKSQQDQLQNFMGQGRSKNSYNAQPLTGQQKQQQDAYYQTIQTTQKQLADLRKKILVIDQLKQIITAGLDGNKSVKHLDLSDSFMRDDIARDLSVILGNNKDIVYFNIANNELTQEGSIAICTALNDNYSLQYLNLSHNKLPPDALDILAKSLSTNNTLKYLSLGYNQQNSTPDSSGHLSTIISTTKTITCLNLEYMGLGSEGLKVLLDSLIDYAAIRDLNIAGNGLSEDSIDNLSNLLQNETCNLERLVISDNALSNTALVKLAQILKTNTTIKEVELESIGANGEAGGDAIALFLRENNTITSLRIGKNALDYLGTKKIAEALKTNKSLQSVTMPTNGLDEAGAIYIAKSLELNNSLTKLDLSDNAIQSAGLIYLSAALESNRSVIHLNLSKNQITDEGIEALASVLQHIITLDLSYNQITTAGAYFLAEGLKSSHMRILVLDYNNSIGQEGAVAIVSALKENFSLHTLGIAGINLQHHGLETLLPFLIENIGISRIRLDQNNFNANSAELVARLITENGFITSLSLDKSNFEQQIQSQLQSPKKTGEELLEQAFLESSVIDITGLKDENELIKKALLKNSAKLSSCLRALNEEEISLNSQDLYKLARQLQNKKTAITPELIFAEDKEGMHYLDKIIEHFAKIKAAKSDIFSEMKECEMKESEVPSMEYRCFEPLDQVDFLGDFITYGEI